MVKTHQVVEPPSLVCFEHREDPGEVLNTLQPVLAKLGIVLEQLQGGGDMYLAFVGLRAATDAEKEEVLS